MKINKNVIFNISIILIFFLLAMYIGSFHEPWEDEAHAWLLARDASVFELIAKYAHSDGHPILWHLVLKLFIFFKLPYTKIYIISVLFSTLGVSLFVFKSKFNNLIKVLFTFSYFILYQYTVVSRGYCLILPLLSFIAILWEDRHKKIYLFTLFICLLLSSEVYTFLLAGVIYFLLICEFIKNKYVNKKAHIICFVILFLMFLFTTIYCFPLSTNTFGRTISASTYYVSYSFFYPFNELSNNVVITEVGALITTIIIIFVFYKVYKNDKEKMIQFLAFMILPIIFLIFKYFSGWHLGIITLITIFCLWIHGYQDNSLVKKFLIFSLICQIPWTAVTVYNDLKKPYYGSEEAANFIKTYDYKNLKIYGADFYATSLNPYFEKNIYYNMDDKGFFYWDISSSYYDILFDESKEEYNFNRDKMTASNIGTLYAYRFEIDKDFYLDNEIDIIVFTDNDTSNYKCYDELLEYYNEYEFDSNMYFELDEYEHRNHYILIKKDIDWRSNNEEVLEDNATRSLD